MGRSGEHRRGAVARWVAGWVAGVVALDPGQMVWPAARGEAEARTGRARGADPWAVGVGAAGHDRSVAVGMVTGDYERSEPATDEKDGWRGHRAQT